ncbi:hypothetical protein PR048_022377 [Dryococelus australis]|uniref:Uncharacterized protein n=1 Tax=Dryococelus australis TaxID=614101 RepID=A0ABQ9H0U8_9NEOP|nr:hypothetical protein PR048_022377 [Dryococelus australis]
MCQPHRTGIAELPWNRRLHVGDQCTEVGFGYVSYTQTDHEFHGSDRSSTFCPAKETTTKRRRNSPMTSLLRSTYLYSMAAPQRDGSKVRSKSGFAAQRRRDPRITGKGAKPVRSPPPPIPPVAEHVAPPTECKITAKRHASTTADRMRESYSGIVNLKAVHNTVSSFEINLIKTSHLLPAYIFTCELSDMRPVNCNSRDEHHVALVHFRGLVCGECRRRCHIVICPLSHSYSISVPQSKLRNSRACSECLLYPHAGTDKLADTRPFTDWLRNARLWELASCLTGYCVLRKIPYWLGYLLASRISGVDWRTAFRHAAYRHKRLEFAINNTDTIQHLHKQHYTATNTTPTDIKHTTDNSLKRQQSAPLSPERMAVLCARTSPTGTHRAATPRDVTPPRLTDDLAQPPFCQFPPRAAGATPRNENILGNNNQPSKARAPRGCVGYARPTNNICMIGSASLLIIWDQHAPVDPHHTHLLVLMAAIPDVGRHTTLQLDNGDAGSQGLLGTDLTIHRRGFESRDFMGEIPGIICMLVLAEFLRRPVRRWRSTHIKQPQFSRNFTMERSWNEGAGETGDPEKTRPPTNGIVRHNCHLRKSVERATVASGQLEDFCKKIWRCCSFQPADNNACNKEVCRAAHCEGEAEADAAVRLHSLRAVIHLVCGNHGDEATAVLVCGPPNISGSLWLPAPRPKTRHSPTCSVQCCPPKLRLAGSSFYMPSQSVHISFSIFFRHCMYFTHKPTRFRKMSPDIFLRAFAMEKFVILYWYHILSNYRLFKIKMYVALLHKCCITQPTKATKATIREQERAVFTQYETVTLHDGQCRALFTAIVSAVFTQYETVTLHDGQCRALFTAIVSAVFTQYETVTLHDGQCRALFTAIVSAVFTQYETVTLHDGQCRALFTAIVSAVFTQYETVTLHDGQCRALFTAIVSAVFTQYETVTLHDGQCRALFTAIVSAVFTQYETVTLHDGQCRALFTAIVSAVFTQYETVTLHDGQCRALFTAIVSAVFTQYETVTLHDGQCRALFTAIVSAVFTQYETVTLHDGQCRALFTAIVKRVALRHKLFPTNGFQIRSLFPAPAKRRCEERILATTTLRVHCLHRGQNERGIILHTYFKMLSERCRFNAELSIDIRAYTHPGHNKPRSRDRGGVVVRLGELGSIPSGVAPGFSHTSRFFHSGIPALLHTHLTSPSSALKTNLSTPQRHPGIIIEGHGHTKQRAWVPDDTWSRSSRKKIALHGDICYSLFEVNGPLLNARLRTHAHSATHKFELVKQIRAVCNVHSLLTLAPSGAYMLLKYDRWAIFKQSTLPSAKYAFDYPIVKYGFDCHVIKYVFNCPIRDHTRVTAGEARDFTIGRETTRRDVTATVGGKEHDTSGSGAGAQPLRRLSPTYGRRNLGIGPHDAAGRRVFSELHSGAAPYSPHFALIGSQDLDVKCRPNRFTHLLIKNIYSYFIYIHRPHTTSSDFSRFFLTPATLLYDKLKAGLVYLELFTTFGAEKRGSDKGNTATHIKCAIATKRMTLNWRAMFSKYCVYLWGFQRRPHHLIGGKSPDRLSVIPQDAGRLTVSACEEGRVEVCHPPPPPAESNAGTKHNQVQAVHRAVTFSMVDFKSAHFVANGLQQHSARVQCVRECASIWEDHDLMNSSRRRKITRPAEIVDHARDGARFRSAGVVNSDSIAELIACASGASRGGPRQKLPLLRPVTSAVQPISPRHMLPPPVVVELWFADHWLGPRLSANKGEAPRSEIYFCSGYNEIIFKSKYRVSPLKEAPWDVCKRGNTVQCDNKIPRTTPKVVKGTGEDMLRDGIDSCPTGHLLKDSPCPSGHSFFLLSRQPPRVAAVLDQCVSSLHHTFLRKPEQVPVRRLLSKIATTTVFLNHSRILGRFRNTESGQFLAHSCNVECIPAKTMSLFGALKTEIKAPFCLSNTVAQDSTYDSSHTPEGVLHIMGRTTRKFAYICSNSYMAKTTGKDEQVYICTFITDQRRRSTSLTESAVADSNPAIAVDDAWSDGVEGNIAAGLNPTCSRSAGRVNIHPPPPILPQTHQRHIPLFAMFVNTGPPALRDFQRRAPPPPSPLEPITLLSPRLCMIQYYRPYSCFNQIIVESGQQYLVSEPVAARSYAVDVFAQQRFVRTGFVHAVPPVCGLLEARFIPPPLLHHTLALVALLINWFSLQEKFSTREHLTINRAMRKRSINFKGNLFTAVEKAQEAFKLSITHTSTNGASNDLRENSRSALTLEIEIIYKQGHCGNGGALRNDISNACDAFKALCTYLRTIVSWENLYFKQTATQFKSKVSGPGSRLHKGSSGDRSATESTVFVSVVCECTASPRCNTITRKSSAGTACGAMLQDLQHAYTEVTFAIVSEIIRHALDDSASIADLQKTRK